jgi:hypothetical protein
VVAGVRVPSLVGQLPQTVDDAADQVARGEGAGHREDGERAGAVGQAPRRRGAGDDLDDPLAG